MKTYGPKIDLTSYQEVKQHADWIFGVTSSHRMPPRRPWSEEYLNTFRAWLEAGCPRGVGPLEGVNLLDQEPQRVRRSFTDLVQNHPEEFELFKKAFEGIKNLPPEDKNSYFYLASIHGLPGPAWCWHHWAGFVPWHRQYTMAFEDALRSIEGCENVTMPYWDQFATNGIPPKELYEPPFDKYDYPIVIEFDDGDRGPGTQHPSTFRASLQQMTDDLADYRKQIVAQIKIAMATNFYEDFARYRADGPQVERGHDIMHNTLSGSKGDKTIAINPATGETDTGTMAYVEFTAYDPIFWFMHCDYDRLLFEWQRSRNALSVDALIKTFNEKDLVKHYLDVPMDPWTIASNYDRDVTFRDLVGGAGVTYAGGSFTGELLAPAPRHFKGINSRFGKVTVRRGHEVVLRNFDRTQIKGSFKVLLFKENGEAAVPVGEFSFFQRIDSNLCPRCKENALINVGFRIGEIEPDCSLSFKVFDFKNHQVPLRKLGNVVITIHNIIE